ncbi:MAG: FkbM family methyltransferase [Pirellulaceae bacterium]|nr:FkbM family methyltransferase [Pirellulaceae bacterium]
MRLVRSNLIARIRQSRVRFVNLGPFCWPRYAFHRLRERWYRSKSTESNSPFRQFKLYSPLVPFPLWARQGTSDISVFQQVFGDLEYNELRKLEWDRTGLVVDCGANVGFSSAFLMNLFPNMKVVAVEPDSSNCEQLKINLAPFSERLTVIEAGVWSEDGGLCFSDSPYRDGQHWSRQVRKSLPNETPALMAVTISTILKNSGFDKIWLLKVDIERAECVVFAENVEDWLPKVENIVIELHDQECERIFFDAVRSKDFSVTRSGDLTLCLASKASD